MKKHWLAVALIAFFLGIFVIALIRIVGSPSEPEYDGRKLASWLDDLEPEYNRSDAAYTNAEFAIRQMGTNAVPFLVQMLHTKDSPFKRKYMELLIRQLARQQWIHFHFRFRFDFMKREEAMRGLGALGPDAKSAIPDLADLLKKEGQGGSAASALSQIGPSALSALENGLTNTNEYARENAAMGLGALGEPSSVPNLLAALNDPDATTRVSVVGSLLWFPAQANIIAPVLVNSLDDPVDVVRANALRDLENFGTNARPAFPKLLKMVVSANVNNSQIATVALMKIDYKATLAAFVKNLESPDANVRTNTARALTHFNPDGELAPPFLVKCLQDPDVQVRKYATIAIGDIGLDPDLTEGVLIENLDDPDPDLRLDTAITLGKYGERAKPAARKIFPAIEQYKGDKKAFVPLYNALYNIDPEAAAKLNAK